MKADQRAALEDAIMDFALAKAEAASMGRPYDNAGNEEWDDIGFILDDLEARRGTVRRRRPARQRQA